MPYKDSDERRQYHAEYRERNREKLREKDRKYRDENREHTNNVAARSHRRRMRQKRRDLATALGNACVDCGSTDERVFQFHHANGGGNALRKRGGKGGYTAAYYQGMLDEVAADPGSILLLCANCHAIRHWKEDDE